MNKKRWLPMSFILLFICLICSRDLVYAEETGQESSTATGEVQTQSAEGNNMLFDVFTRFPEEKIKKSKEAGYEVNYARYDSSRYTLEFEADGQNWWDIAERAENIGHYTLYQLDNTIWQVILSWDFTVISAIQSAFSLDIVNEFAETVEKTIQQFAGFNGTTIVSGKGLWGGFILFVIVISGAWFAYRGLYKRDQTNAVSSIITMMVIFMASLAFFANAGGIMKDLNAISSGISTELMGISLNLGDVGTDGGSSEDDVVDGIRNGAGKPQNSNEVKASPVTYPFRLADQVYHLLIYEPYLMLQYGNVDGSDAVNYARAKKLLSQKPGSEARKQVVKQEVLGTDGNPPNIMMTTKGTFQRLSILLLLGITHFVIGIVFFLTAGAVILYQFFFIIFALFAPIALLLALYPAWSSIAVNWLKTFLGYQLIKIILGVFLSILLTISNFLYRLTPPKDYGYSWTIIMQLILVVGVMWKRKELYGVLNTTFSGKPDKGIADPGLRNMLNKINQYASNTSTRLGKIRRK
ncbi:CD3337/EF1877 family mobilome membrane protein [Thermoactinomyces sp. DSM 45892]|uniref:CD3337/EF1877 family mobilome membrane protein n=1 Tax=Thermoactinomyces sp. DSM 45892 TaxID=1882753 RepID=UPI0008947B8E|nr:type IV secretion system protein [Thermoactinomyces sp. DSM 45892]SDZ28571.1 TrbL/VirB6 plasmid conjugal transfer protein [Thermoactinomyces sp. DSM 45892]